MGCNPTVKCRNEAWAERELHGLLHGGFAGGWQPARTLMFSRVRLLMQFGRVVHAEAG